MVTTVFFTLQFKAQFESDTRDDRTHSFISFLKFRASVHIYMPILKDSIHKNIKKTRHNLRVCTYKCISNHEHTNTRTHSIRSNLVINTAWWIFLVFFFISEALLCVLNLTKYEKYFKWINVNNFKNVVCFTYCIRDCTWQEVAQTILNRLSAFCAILYFYSSFLDKCMYMFTYYIYMIKRHK